MNKMTIALLLMLTLSGCSIRWSSEPESIFERSRTICEETGGTFTKNFTCDYPNWPPNSTSVPDTTLALLGVQT